jgi:hypothetical protein
MGFLQSAFDGKEGNTIGKDFGSYVKQRSPTLGGLGEMVFGGGQQQAPLPEMNLPQQPMPDNSEIIAQNAKPPEGGGGLSMILKMLAGGG